jgi:hypothetical protein
MDEKRQTIQDQANDSAAQRQLQAALYADEVKVCLMSFFWAIWIYEGALSEITSTMSLRWKRLCARGH